jgi:hypothetical protein
LYLFTVWTCFSELIFFLFKYSSRKTRATLTGPW